MREDPYCWHCGHCKCGECPNDCKGNCMEQAEE